MAQDLAKTKEMGNKQIREAETKLYSESHTKNLLTDERRKLTTILNLLRT